MRLCKVRLNAKAKQRSITIKGKVFTHDWCWVPAGDVLSYLQVVVGDDVHPLEAMTDLGDPIHLESIPSELRSAPATEPGPKRAPTRPPGPPTLGRPPIGTMRRLTQRESEVTGLTTSAIVGNVGGIILVFKAVNTGKVSKWELAPTSVHAAMLGLWG